MTGELVRALSCFVGDERRGGARRFLRGLSADELQYIADFLGSHILESNHRQPCRDWPLAQDIVDFERCRVSRRVRKDCRVAALQDEEHKMILLFEYIRRCGYEQSMDAAQA